MVKCGPCLRTFANFVVLLQNRYWPPTYELIMPTNECKVYLLKQLNRFVIKNGDRCYKPNKLMQTIAQVSLIATKILKNVICGEELFD